MRLTRVGALALYLNSKKVLRSTLILFAKTFCHVKKGKKSLFMAVLLILFSIRMKLLSFDIVNFGFPQSLENMLYDFMSFKLFSSGYKHISSTY